MDESSESGHKWPEFRTKLKPLPADSLLDDGPYIFMDIDHLEEERLAILETLPHPSGNPIYPSKEEAMAIGFEFSRVARFSERPPATALRQSLSLLDATQSGRVFYRLAQIGTTIRSAREIWGRDYEPSRTFAVSHRWDRRWEALLCGGIYLAFVGILEFPSSHPQ